MYIFSYTFSIGLAFRTGLEMVTKRGKFFRLPSSPVNTTKIGDALNHTKCHALISCVWCCVESANCSEESSSVLDWIVLDMNHSL